MNSEFTKIGFMIAITSLLVALFAWIYPDPLNFSKSIQNTNDISENSSVSSVKGKNIHDTNSFYEAIANLVIKDKMWFESYHETNVEIEIVGRSLDNNTIREFRERIENIEALKDVKLQELKAVEYKRLRLIEFVIKITK